MTYDYRRARDWIFGLVREGEKVIAYADTNASIKERALLLALVEFAPSIEPSTSALASMLGTSEREVRRLLRSAQAKSLLGVQHRPGHRSRYVITDPGHNVPPADMSPRTQCPPTPADMSSPPRTYCPPKQTTKADKEADNTLRARPGSPKEGASKRKRKSNPETPLPADWRPTEAHRAYAAKHGLDLELEVDGLRGWADGRSAVSWDGTFTTRLSNQAKWNRSRGGNMRKGIVESQHGGLSQDIVQRARAAGERLAGGAE